MILHSTDVRAGDILLGHNLIIAPALLLEKETSLDEGRLLDFCTFVCFTFT